MPCSEDIDYIRDLLDEFELQENQQISSLIQALEKANYDDESEQDEDED